MSADEVLFGNRWAGLFDEGGWKTINQIFENKDGYQVKKELMVNDLVGIGDEGRGKLR